MDPTTKTRECVHTKYECHVGRGGTEVGRCLCWCEKPYLLRPTRGYDVMSSEIVVNRAIATKHDYVYVSCCVSAPSLVITACSTSFLPPLANTICATPLSDPIGAKPMEAHTSCNNRLRV